MKHTKIENEPKKKHMVQIDVQAIKYKPERVIAAQQSKPSDDFNAQIEAVFKMTPEKKKEF